VALKKRTEKVRPPEPGEDGALKTDGRRIHETDSANGNGRFGSGSSNGKEKKSTSIVGERVATEAIASVPPYKGRLGELLLEKKLVTQDELDKALIEQSETGGRLGEVLVEMGVIDNQALANELASFFGLTVVNLRRDNVDPKVIELVPEDFARASSVIPVRL